MDGKRPWYRRFLAWLRIEDEHGVLSLTTIGFVAGVVCLLSGRQVSLAELAAFTVGLGAYHAKTRMRHRQAEVTMEGAHEHAMAQLEHKNSMEKQKRSDDAEELNKKVDELAGKVRELATPERMEALQRMRRGG